MTGFRFLLALSFLTIAASLAWPTQALTLHPGDIVVSNNDSRSIMRVDPVTGAVTDIVKGGGLGNLRGLVIESDNSILVASQESTSVGGPKIYRIDPETGAKSISAF